RSGRAPCPDLGAPGAWAAALASEHPNPGRDDGRPPRGRSARDNKAQHRGAHCERVMAGLTLARMAVRELWISFRLLVLLALPLAMAMVIGSFVGPIGAAVLAMLASGVLLSSGLVLSPEPPVVPTAGLGLIAQATDLLRPFADGLQALGLGLTMTGLLLGAAVLVFERVDL